MSHLVRMNANASDIPGDESETYLEKFFHTNYGYIKITRAHEYHSTLDSLFYHICTCCIKMTSVLYTLVLCVNIREMERETILPLTMEVLGVRKTFLIEY